MRATPLKVQSDIAVRLNCQRGPGLDVHGKNDAVRLRKNAFPLLRLIREGEKPDHLVRLDQNGDDDADERQASGEVEPHDAESVGAGKASARPAVAAPTANSSVTIAGASASAGTRFRMPRAAISAASRMPANNSLPGAGGARSADSDNLTAVQEGHRILIRALELW